MAAECPARVSCDALLPQQPVITVSCQVLIEDDDEVEERASVLYQCTLSQLSVKRFLAVHVRAVRELQTLGNTLLSLSIDSCHLGGFGTTRFWCLCLLLAPHISRKNSEDRRITDYLSRVN